MKRLIRRGLLAAYLLCIGVCLAPAQPVTETPTEANAASEFTPFAIEPLLSMTANQDIFWRPDWALTLPVDAFELTADSPRPRAITVSLEEAEYRVAWKSDGSLAAFPTLVNGVFTQLTLTSAGFIIAGAPHCTLTFIDTADSGVVPDIASPSLAQIALAGGAVYFAALDFAGNLVTETWYDADGNVIALFSSRLAALRAESKVPIALESRVIDTLLAGTPVADSTEYNTAYERYDYDSFGNITAIESPRGNFTAVYVQSHRPRYWETVVNGTRWRYTLQWDDVGHLTRITGDSLNTSDANVSDTNAANDAFVDLHYDYTFDAHGNWVTRRETRMIRRLGALIPSAGATVTRRIEYGTDL
jgi:YD repeat-containing protein